VWACSKRSSFSQSVSMRDYYVNSATGKVSQMAMTMKTICKKKMF
jgi:hypothetical protein